MDEVGGDAVDDAGEDAVDEGPGCPVEAGRASRNDTRSPPPMSIVFDEPRAVSSPEHAGSNNPAANETMASEAVANETAPTISATLRLMDRTVPPAGATPPAALG